MWWLSTQQSRQVLRWGPRGGTGAQSKLYPLENMPGPDPKIVTITVVCDRCSL